MSPRDERAIADLARYADLPPEERDELADWWSDTIYFCPACAEGRLRDCKTCSLYPLDHDATGYIGTGTDYSEPMRRLASAIATDPVRLPMTDSTPQYQRATQDDERWLEDEILGEGYECNTFRVERYRRILNSLRATPAVPDRQTRFTNEHAKGLGAVMDKLQKANGPVVLSWEEADAVLDFAEAALAMEATAPVLEHEPYVDEVAFAIWCGRRQLLEVVGLDEALSLWAKEGPRIQGVYQQLALQAIPRLSAAPQVETQTT